MASFATIAAHYKNSDGHVPPLYKDVSVAIMKVNGLRNEIHYRQGLIDKLDGDFSQQAIDRFKASMKSELQTSRISLDDFKITSTNHRKLHCLYNVKHAGFYFYAKEYVGNRNWIPCGWAEKDKQHVIIHGLEKARDAYVKKLEKEIDTKRGELEFAETQLTTALHAAIDGGGGEENGETKAA